ncbi:MAG: hypothetical protein RJA07_2253 [Bacteroidota bacterium]|jgi:hypothetical protein
MHKLINVTAKPNALLECVFENNIKKTADIKPFLDSEVFSVLKNEKIFQNLTCHSYFVSWQNEEIDLSADTLWHVGK